MERVLPPWVNSEKCLEVTACDIDNSVAMLLPKTYKTRANGALDINGMSSEGWLIAIVVCRDEF
eukprot:scaffold71234_cov82-Cyclotella_meneghiniana.AAC.7